MKSSILLLFLLFPFAYALGQGSITGVVTNEELQPLPGANIQLSKSSPGQVTDQAGKFMFRLVPAGDYQLVVSFIGYETQTLSVRVTDREITSLDVKLISGAIQLSDVVISATPDRPVNTLSQIDIKFRPVATSQDVLRMVPGLFIAQHAGGGKAEQLFLRGFDCDHGTDVRIDVDGMPVNMVSHAHGQGYADLHFLIPETVQYADFDKGPYFSSKGDFTTAGYVSFQTKKNLERNFVKLEGGSFYTGRAVAGVNLVQTRKTSAYLVSEAFRSNGFFENNQQFKRLNIQLKSTTQLSPQTTLTTSITGFDSRWDASGQIPDRAISNNSITRYGSIDPTEGGTTSRFNSYVKLDHSFKNGGSLENQVYAVRYNFNLYSNFTFFLNDDVNGDQINQIDHRWVYGYNSVYRNSTSLGNKNLKTEVGAGIRYDRVGDVELNHTIKRSFLNPIMQGEIQEANISGYVSETLFLSSDLSINAGARIDYFSFSYNDKLSTLQLPSVSKMIVSPKLNIHWNASQQLSFFVRTGTGFHSNDARVVVQEKGNEILPRALGVDVGMDAKITPSLLFHLALWRLDLAQEFVYVGDEGIVEPSGKTKRLGIDASVRYQIKSWLFADLDMNLTQPRMKDTPAGENYVPLAPVFTSIAGLTVRKGNGLNGSLRYRYIGDRPANETNDIIAKGYFITDAIVNYTTKKWELGISAENVFNARWKEAQFNTLSKLQNETLPVEEIHFTPGTPFSMRLRFSVFF